MDRDQGDQACPEDRRKPVGCVQSDPVAPKNRQGKKGYDPQGTNQPQFFTADGKNIVIILKRQIQIFLPGFSEAQSEYASGPDGV